MSKEWIIKISENDYIFGYINGSTAIELEEDLRSFLKDHPEGSVIHFFELKIYQYF